MISLYLYYSYTEAPLMRGIVSVSSPALLGTACFRQSDGVLKRQSAVRALSQEDPELFGVPMTKARERFRQNTSGEVKIRSDGVFFKALGKTTTTRPLRCFLSPSPSCCRQLCLQIFKHAHYRCLCVHACAESSEVLRNRLIRQRRTITEQPLPVSGPDVEHMINTNIGTRPLTDHCLRSQM